MYKLTFYVPETHLEMVKNAIFDKGAGKIGAYDRCAWQVLGMGQYRPLENSHPYIGTEGQLESCPEYQVETVCDDKALKAVLKALIEVHPYETPAYAFWKVNE